MARADLAELYASSLSAIPTPDGGVLKFLHWSDFGQAEDTKQRIATLAQGVGEALVHLAESHGYVISHPSDPAEVEPSGARVVQLMCQCGQAICALGIDDSDRVTIHPTALQSLAQTGHTCV